MSKDNQYYLSKTLEEIDTILEYSRNLTILQLQQQPIVLDAIIFRMVQMSEHMDKISDDYKALHPEIEWLDIKGFRNRLVHDYGGVDLHFVYSAITEDIPKLRIQINAILI